MACTLADLAILTTDNPRFEDPAAIARDVEAGSRPTRDRIVELDRAKAIALALARPGDVVVIAGKGHELVQEARGAETAFSDVEVARRAV